MSLGIDLSQVTGILQQLLPLIIQIAILGLVMSIVFNTLVPMLTQAGR